jgi:hypothetical protein
MIKASDRARDAKRTGGPSVTGFRGNAMDPLLVQVITYAPTAFYHCQHCELTFKEMGFGDRVHQEQSRESLPEDLRDEFHQLADWVASLHDRYGDRLRVKIIDATSLEGVWRSLRYGARRYPFVIIDGGHRHTGTDFSALEPHIDQSLAEAEQAHAGGGGASP